MGDGSGKVNNKYKIGKITAKNVAVGDRADAGDHVHRQPLQADAIYQVRQLIELLSAHAGEVENAGEIRDYADSVETALQKRRPNRDRIEKLVRKITTGLAGVTALANAVDAVHAAIGRLFA
jgi:hypothetical protein